jgi:aminotransferase EvaB
MEKIPINDLSRLSEDDLSAFNQIFSKICASGYFMLGPHTKNFEKLLAELVRMPNVVCVANGTDALTLALLTMGVSQNSKVITVANAGGYTTTAALRLGAHPILADIAISNGQMDPGSLRSVLTQHPDTHTVVVTHLFGLMAPIEEISEICQEFKVKLIEDCAQSIGASLGDRPAGSWGDASTFSFYPTKNLGCLGDGGAVALRVREDAQKLRQLAQYGWGERYSVELRSGFNSRIDEIQAAILNYRLKKLAVENNIRREIISRYAGALTHGRRMLWRDDSSFVGHLAILITDQRAADQTYLEEHGISTGIHYPIVDHLQQAWVPVFEGQTSYAAEKLSQHILTLPCFPTLTENEVQRVCTVLSNLP